MKNFRKFCWNRFVGTAVLFSTSLGMCADVEFFGVVKRQGFIQGNPAAPQLVEVEHEDTNAEPPFVFLAFVDLATSNAVTNATITLPGGGVRSLVLGEGGGNRDFSDGTEFKPDLDRTYSNGTYTVFFQTQNDGDKTIPLTFPPGDAYPNPPRISNFSAAQSINAAADFTLTWDLFAGGLATDFIQVSIDDPTGSPVFETVGPGQPGSLNGTSNSVVIPAGTLSASSYRVRIFFAKIVDFDDTTYGGGVTGVAAFLAETTFDARTTGGSDTNAPDLESQSPHNMQGEVKGSAVVAFTFNEPMNTALSLGSSVSWSTNINAGLVTYTWSAAGRTLFCAYPPGFPTNALITWELNPSGSPENLRDLANNKLPTRNGSFNTGSETGAGEKDVDFITFVKGRIFRQTNSVAEDAELYQFGLISDLNTFNGVTNGLLTLPSALTISPELDSGDTFDFEALYSSQAQLDLFFPDGSYQARFDTVHDGTRTFNFTLSGSTYPNAPEIQNFAAAQSVDPTNAFVLSWGAFAGGTTNDFMALEIEADDDFSGGVFETPNVNEPGALNGTNTSVTIPAFTFAPGRTYHCQLYFVKAGQLDTNTYPGVIAASGYFSLTFFEMHTVGQTIRPSLQISKASGNSVRITVTGEKNRMYTVESASSLSGNPIQWTPSISGTANTNVNGFTASFSFDDSLAPGGARFYRALEGSNFGGNP